MKVIESLREMFSISKGQWLWLAAFFVTAMSWALASVLPVVLALFGAIGGIIVLFAGPLVYMNIQWSRENEAWWKDNNSDAYEPEEAYRRAINRTKRLGDYRFAKYAKQYGLDVVSTTRHQGGYKITTTLEKVEE